MIILKKYRAVLETILLTVFLLLAAQAAPAAEPAITAEAAVLMDANTGQVCYGKNIMKRMEPASITKVMTAVLALEYGRPDEIVIPGKKASRTRIGQDIGLAADDRITLHNLLTAALVHSANDATVAIAQHLGGGSEERFIEMMNARALLLGALDTRFENTNGLHSPNHYTTAYDLALIIRYAMSDQRFSSLVSMPSATVSWADGKKTLTVENTNGLVRDSRYPGICGVKTGTTSKAGNCLAAAAKKENRYFITVVLHSGNRYRDTIKLLDFGFEDLEQVTLCGKSTIKGEAAVAKGVEKSVPVAANGTAQVLLEESQQKNVKETVTIKTLTAPVPKGCQAGRVTYTHKGIELARVDLVAAAAVDRPGLLFWLKSKAIDFDRLMRRNIN